MKKINNILFGVIIGTISTIGVILIPVVFPITENEFQVVIELTTAIATVITVIVSLYVTISANNAKKVKFNHKVEMELGKRDSSTINSIKYRIYGFNSGDIGDAIKTIHFSFQYKGRYEKLFSKEQIINIEAGKFIDFSCEEEITLVSEFFETNTTEKLTGYVIGKYNSASYELITYSGKIYNGDIDVVVQSKPKWRVTDVLNYEGAFQILGIDGQTLLNKQMLKDDSAKAKFSVDKQLLEAGRPGVYSLLSNEETANEVLDQYINEQNDKY